jgi:hypothetical protein
MSKDKIKALVIKALSKPTQTSGIVTESRMSYDENHTERMTSNLSKQLREKTHSLGGHPAFPDEDESNFEEKLMSKRFKDVLKAFKRHNGVEVVDPHTLLVDQGKMLIQIIALEAKHQDRLIELAIQLVRDEFDVTEEDVHIEAKFTTDMSLNKNIDQIKIKPTSDVVFDNHEEMVEANKEVYKRRMVNALIQGSAKKTNHMFHMIDAELQELEPLLPSFYSKLMTGADYMYMINDDTKPRVIGGIVNVEFPKSEGEIPSIVVEALTLPVLIHEIVKGVMEILSYHGLPKDSKVAKYAIDKGDFMAAESWDMRLGPPIWEKFCESIPSEDFALKHHVYVELVSLPVEEFNTTLREILMGSRTGKAKIQEILEEVKDDLRNDEFDNAMDMASDDEYLGPEDLDNIDGEDWFM